MLRNLAILLLSAGVAAAEERPEVAVDARFEVLATLMRLAGAPEYGQARGPYAAAVAKHFVWFAGHPAVQATRELRARHGIGYDAPARLSAVLDSSLRLVGPLPERWQGAPVAEYLEQVRDFAARADVAGFLKEQAAYTAEVERGFRAFLADKPIMTWFDATFGPRPGARVVLVPGLLDARRSYGFTAGDTLYEVIGVETPPPMLHDLVAHELAHSYVNPLIEAREPAWRDAVAPVYARVRETMAGQAYATPAVVVDESVVRAVVVLYLADRAGAEAARASLAEQERLGFTWTPALVRALDGVRRRNGGRLPAEEVVGATREVFLAAR